MLPNEFIPEVVQTTMLASADAAGKSRILARRSWLEATCNRAALGEGYHFVPGQKAFNLGCPSCVAVYTVNDWEISSDWEPR